MKTSEVHLNRSGAQTCLSAGSRDIPVPCFWLAVNWRLAAVAPERRFGAPRRRKSRQNPQPGKRAVHRLGSRLRRFIKTDSLRATAVFAVGSLLAGCGGHPSQIAPPPPVVTVIQPIAREVVEWDEYTGRLESPETVDVRARVSGYLNKVHFKDGARVKTGDLLFTIDRRPYKADLDRAAADYQRAQSQTELAKNDADRAQKLILTKAISTEDYDTKVKTYTSAQAAEKSD